MNALIIILVQTQTRTEATIVIITLLLVAAIIGYITAWLYYRSVLKRKMIIAESETEKLNHQITRLNANNSDLLENLREKGNETDYLQKEINTLKADHAESVHEADAALVHIANRKHLLDYQSIGKAEKAERDDLKMISGIGPFIEERLHALDIYTFRQISNFSEEDIHVVTEAIEYFPGRIERDEWVLQAHELVRIEGKKAELLKRIRGRKDKIYYDRLGIAHKHHANNLTLITGIGLWIEERLNMLDIYTFDQISNFTPSDVDTISEILEISPERMDIQNWVTQAHRLKKDNSPFSKEIQIV